ncbi:MAG: SDR family oxidoreductase, partial [Oscillospiraceae bacterium]|nr:SDR family oxidoreductase [Oscillospiraceae bacterium]
MDRLKDKVIVISGGTKGVGRAFAEVAGREGAKVVIGGRDEKAAKEALRNIRIYGSDGIFVYTDLLKVDDCKKLFDEAYEHYGKIDGFFNYAGVTPVSPLDSCDEETFDWVMDVNFKACFFCCQQAIKYM